MEKFTAREYIEEFAGNQNNLEDWRKGYPEGLSIEDLSENDTLDIYLADEFLEHFHTGYKELPFCLVDSVTKIAIKDMENYDTRYVI